jgi:hypothetical protein
MHTPIVDAVEVVGVAAGVVGSLGTPVAVWLAAQSWKRESNRARVAEKERRRIQPQRVVVHTEEADWPRADGEGSYRTRVATVVNDSDDPIFDVLLFWQVGEDLTGHSASRVALLPRERWQEAQPVALCHHPNCDEVFASIWFFDVDELGWRRGPRGQLSQIREHLAALGS